MKNRKEIGLAVVGCGTIGRIRAIMARDYPGIGWIGLCDINKELGKKTASSYNCSCQSRRNSCKL